MSTARRRWAVPLVPVAAFVACRALDVLAALLVPVRHGGAGAGHPGAVLAARALAADGGWYRRIAATGYPASLPADVGDREVHSALAFFPVYPGIAAGLERALGIGFLPVATAVSIVAGAAAAAGVAVLTQAWAGGGTAMLAGVLWSVQPASPVTGMPYTESLFTAELVAVLLLLQRRRYGPVLLLLPVTALTRGTMPPLILVVAVHLLRRLRDRRDRQEGLGWPVAALLVAVASAPLWPLAVALRTRRADAYLVVQSGWNGRLELFDPWWRSIRQIAGAGPLDQVVPKLALVSVAVALVLAVAGFALPMPVELRALAPAFLLYLLAVVPPSSSYPRFLLPVVTLPIVAAALLSTRPAALRWAVLGLCVAGQVAWLAWYVLGFRHLTP